MAELDELAQILQDPEQRSYKKRDAISQVRRMAPPNIVELLSLAIADEDRYVREEVVKQLAQVGDRKAVPILINSLADEDYYVRRPNHGHDSIIRLGVGYYFIIVRSIQILPQGPLWKQLLSKNSRLVITSSVGIRGTYTEMEGVRGILPFYDPISLGSSPTRFVRDINLIELVPAVGNGPSISVEVHVDSDSRLQALSSIRVQ